MRLIRNAYGILVGHCCVVKQPLESLGRRWKDYNKWILGVIVRIRADETISATTIKSS